MAANPPLTTAHPYELHDLGTAYADLSKDIGNLVDETTQREIREDIITNYLKAQVDEIGSKIHRDQMVTHPEGCTASPGNFTLVMHLVLQMENWMKDLPQGHAFKPRLEKLLSYCEFAF